MPAELLARMQAVLRRSKGYSQPTLRIGDVVLNLDSREVTVGDKQVHLTGKEYSILELLVLRKGMVLTKEAFLNHLFGTVWGRGYMVRDAAPAQAGNDAALEPDNTSVRALLEVA